MATDPPAATSPARPAWVPDELDPFESRDAEVAAIRSRRAPGDG
jgi:hypothetical protein